METAEKILFAYTCRVLLRRPHTEHELRKKIAKRFEQIESEIVESIIQKLKTLKYLNDEQYAESFIRNQLLRKPQGLRMVGQKLQQKGISKELIKQQIAKAAVNENELAEMAAQKKLKSIANYEYKKQKEKLFRYLTSRGFAYDVALKAVNKRLVESKIHDL